MDANVSTMTMPKTMPVQNFLRYISFQLLAKLKDKLCQLAKGVILINTEEVSVRLLCASDARARPLFNAIVLLPKRH